jgi:tRNA U34 2-thiouridine synthase MnmA/TrmU
MSTDSQRNPSVDLTQHAALMELPPDDMDRICLALFDELEKLLEPMPARLALLVAAKSDAGEVCAIIDAEMRRIIQAMHEAEAAMVEQVDAVQH